MRRRVSVCPMSREIRSGAAGDDSREELEEPDSSSDSEDSSELSSSADDEDDASSDVESPSGRAAALFSNTPSPRFCQ